MELWRSRLILVAKEESWPTAMDECADAENLSRARGEEPVGTASEREPPEEDAQGLSRRLTGC